MLDKMNIKGASFIDQQPNNYISKVEGLYYKTVGKIYTPYVNHKSILFDNQNVQNIYYNKNMQFHNMDIDEFGMLIDYAKRVNFGLF